jgi:hypothetical protein
MDSTQMKLSMAQGLSVLRRLGLVAVLLATIPIGFLAFGMSEDSLGSWATLLGLAVTAGLALGGWLMFWGQGYATDRRAMKAATPPSPQEGRWTAVCGIARPVEAAFDEPVLGGEALACHYEVSEMQYSKRSTGSGGSHRKPVLRYEGFHLVPTLIETGAGPVTLRGFPDLREVEPSTPEAGTPFTLQDSVQPVRSTVLRSILAMFRSRSRIDEATVDRLLGIHTGPVARARPALAVEPRFLWRVRVLAGPMLGTAVDRMYGGLASPGDAIRRSRVLRPGDEVCVLGRWRNGELWPSLNRPNGLPVYPGSLVQALEEVDSDAEALTIVGRWIAGFALAMLGVAVVL